MQDSIEVSNNNAIMLEAEFRDRTTCFFIALTIDQFVK
jgi:hypothetical protein